MVSSPLKLVIICLLVQRITVNYASSHMTCQQEQELRHLQYRPLRVITDAADIYLGALLNVHDQGSAGFFGCGNVTLPGLVAYEALSWIAATINKESGLINGKKVIESFIPGVKIGMSSPCITLAFLCCLFERSKEK